MSMHASRSQRTSSIQLLKHDSKIQTVFHRCHFWFPLAMKAIMLRRSTCSIVITGTLVFFPGCADKAKPDYDKCVVAEAKGDWAEAVAACEQAAALDPGSKAGKAATDRTPGLKAKLADKEKANVTAASKTDPVEDSLGFLAQLDDLMQDYKPDLPTFEDKSDVLRCVTTETVKSNPDIAKAAKSMKSQSDAAKAERRRRQREFYETIYPLAFHYDLDWATRKGKAVAAQYGCLNTTSGLWTNFTDADYCKNNLYWGMPTYQTFEWKIRTPGRNEYFLYSNSETPPTQPPELMRRIEQAKIAVPARFSCRVEDVVGDPGSRTVVCKTPEKGAAEGQPPVAAAPPSRHHGRKQDRERQPETERATSSGATVAIRLRGGEGTQALNVGDVISVPLAGTKRDPDGVLFKNVTGRSGGWTVDAEGSMVAIDAAASCPTVEQIVTAASSGGVPTSGSGTKPAGGK